MSAMNNQEKKVLLGQVTPGTIAPVPSGVVRVFICTAGEGKWHRKNLSPDDPCNAKFPSNVAPEEVTVLMVSQEQL